MYLLEDDKCIYNDNIVCKEPNCEKCDSYVNKKLKKLFRHYEGEQLNIFDVINKQREQYAKRNGKND